MDIFKLKENKTSIKTEIIAGFVTFLTMIYIIPVNASIMSASSMPHEALIVATTVITILACIFNAFYANTPIAMSVGMGMNVYFVYGVCLGLGFPWQSALAAVFASGFIFFILSFTSFRVWILVSIPLDLRRAICVGVGAFIAFIGLSNMGVVVKNDATLVGIGDFSDVKVLFGVFTLVLMLLFWVLKLKAAFILGVLISTVLAWIFNINGATFPSEFISLPNFSAENGLQAIFAKLDLSALLELTLLPVIFTFFLTQLFDSMGTITGVGARGGIFEKEDGEKKLGRTLSADAFSSAVGAVVGTSTVTAFVESSSGVESGGRTGLTALVVAFCFGICLFFLPFFSAIPDICIYPVLVVVGILMFMEVSKIDFSKPSISVASFFIIMMMPLTYSITMGFAFGFISYALVNIFMRDFKALNNGIITLALFSLLVFILQFIK